MGSKRVYYKVDEVIINGTTVRGIDSVGIQMGFNLTQVFCSCPYTPTEKIRQEYSSWCDCCHMDVTIRHSSCPCVEGQTPLRPLTDKEVIEVKDRYS